MNFKGRSSTSRALAPTDNQIRAASGLYFNRLKDLWKGTDYQIPYRVFKGNSISDRWVIIEIDLKSRFKINTFKNKTSLIIIYLSDILDLFLENNKFLKVQVLKIKQLNKNLKIAIVDNSWTIKTNKNIKRAILRCCQFSSELIEKLLDSNFKKFLEICKNIWTISLK